MKYLFTSASETEYRRFLKTDPILVFDYDGTLCPYAHHDLLGAQMRSKTREILKTLSRLRPCAVVSGRGYSDLKKKLEGISLVDIVGNHGSEWRARHPMRMRADDLALARQSVRTWKKILNRELKGIPGVLIEDKKISLSVIYLEADAEDQDRIETGVRELLKNQSDSSCPMREVGGKKILNLAPRVLEDKGSAVVRLKKHYQKKSVIFVGDDRNDEAVFELSERHRVFTVRVEKSAESAAEYYLRSQREMDELLKRAVEWT